MPFLVLNFLGLYGSKDIIVLSKMILTKVQKKTLISFEPFSPKNSVQSSFRTPLNA